MPAILDIARIAVGVPDRKQWEDFSEEVLGLPTFRSKDGRQSYARVDDRHHRFALRDAAEPTLDCVAFDVGGSAALVEWERDLARQRVGFSHVDAERCRDAHLAAALELQDPDGHVLWLGHGFAAAHEPLRTTRPLALLRLGHVLLTVADTARSHDFYTSVLGFRLSDWVCISDTVRLCFLRVNERHHTLALGPCAPGASPRLQHAMLEVETLDDVMRSYHHARLRGAPIGMGPGKHPNCQTIHCYVQTPGGFAIEFGFGHRRIDEESYEPKLFPPGTPVDVWGGDVQSAQFVIG